MTPLLFFTTLIWTLCISPVYALRLPRWTSWGRSPGSDTSHKVVGSSPDGPSTSWNATQSYTFSVPSASIITPSPTSQGMSVTSIVPLYEICDRPGSNTTVCSTVFDTLTTQSCSTVLTYAFTKTTITECDHNITFSSQNTYALATTTLPATVAGIQNRDAPTPTSPTAITYVQSTVSYFVAPWQSLAAESPTGITVLICTTDFSNVETCVSVEEVWIVHTEYVPVTTTSLLTISTLLSTDVMLLLGSSQSLVASAGPFSLSTLIEHASMSPNATTSTSTSTLSSTLAGSSDDILPANLNKAIKTPTTTSMRTVTLTGPTSTVTKTLSQLSQSLSQSPSQISETGGPRTTRTSKITLTSTVTVYPLPKV